MNVISYSNYIGNVKKLEKMYDSKESFKRWGHTSIELPPHTVLIGNYKYLSTHIQSSGSIIGKIVVHWIPFGSAEKGSYTFDSFYV